MTKYLLPYFVLISMCCFSNIAIAGSRPNILLITVDDMNADSVGVFGSGVANITPNIDRLAAEGLRFERAHVQVANCMPSRNVMWSGRYPQSNQIEGFYQVRDPGYPTLADVAKSAGYFTGIRHKLKDSTPYYPFNWDIVLDESSSGMTPEMKDSKSYGYSTEVGIKNAKLRGKPFYLLINVSDPHVPFFGLNRDGEEVVDTFIPSHIYDAKEITVPGFLPEDQVIRKELAHYYSSVRRADDAVGQILHALQASGEAENTLVMFLSDHGMPFPFVKTQLYHMSTLTPLIFRWPGVIKPGSVDREHLVSAVDIMPTLLEAMGEKIPEGVEGRSFFPLLKGEPQDHRDKVFKAYSENSAGQRNPMRAVETNQFLYIFNPWSDGKRVMHSATTGTSTYKRMIELARSDKQISDRLNMLNHRVLEEFYNIENDPDCLVNLIHVPAYQQKIQELRDLLAAWLLDVNDPMLTAFLGRNDPELLASYMREQEQGARQRNEWRRAIKKRLQKKGNANEETEL